MKWIRRRAVAAADFSSILRLSAIRSGKRAHAHILASGLLPHVTLQTDLLLMYSRCSDLISARRIFDEMPQRSPHTWNILFYSYANSSHPCKCLLLFPLFLNSGFRPDHYTFPSLLKACAATKSLLLGMSLHCMVLVAGYGEDVIVGSSIVDMYARLGFLVFARTLFDEMPYQDTASCNSMISALARGELFSEALSYFKKLQWKEVEADPMAIPSVLSACGRTEDLIKGKEIHAKVLRSPRKMNSDTTIWNALIEMYSRCGLLSEAWKVFYHMSCRNSVSWTTLISCCGFHGKGPQSIDLFNEMIASGIIPNAVTFTSILSSCSHSGLVSRGREIFHSMAPVHGVNPAAEHYACMVDLLSRSGKLLEAISIIRTMPMVPNASIWGALLGGAVIHKDVAVAELASGELFALEPRNAANYAALCGVYTAVSCDGDARRIKERMKELHLVKSPARSWIPL